MKKIISILFVLISVVSSAQIFTPVEWEFSQKQLSDTEIELQFKANIDEGWHLYSQHIADDGPVPTEFTFITEGSYELIDNVIEGEPIEEFDPNFDMVLKYFGHEAIFTQKIKITSAEDFTLAGDVYFMVCDEAQCLPPEVAEFSFKIKGVDGGSVVAETENTTDKKEGKGMWGLFFIAFISGFAALLTPCVFPMIPMTVSFFTKQSKTKAKGIANAIIYGLSIIVIYVALGVGVSSVFGADALNNMATNVYFNIGFFLLLIVFAASFLGAFEIQLPASWTNKSVEAEGKGGLIGIFFMAFTLALVSFSCTGPIVGTLLVEAATGGYMGPIIGMLGFSLAIALPFALFAAFPGWLNSLPQSGGWLNSVKVTLGFLEIALAFKFLSNADLVMQTHWLERELFIAIWIMIFGLLTMYLLGFLKFAHDSDLKHISVGRLSVAILTGTLTLYMIPGLWGAPLKLISAFPPPLEYSESPYGVGYTLGGETSSHVEEQHLGPQGIMAFNDYDLGVAYAKETGLPIVIDFTGKACVNCRKMEQDVWSDPIIKDILKNKVVLISLYVDLKTKLPKDKQYETTLAGKSKKVRSIGDQWMVLQANTYGTNSQPYYVFLNHKEEMLVENANYQDYGTVELFKDWLNRGLKEFKK
ncbi:MAG: thioredoxin fold domain-containing protein [Flavobacteriales bacterium]|jgi:thiol:disulfide interchange protein|nr:thioredoxin fold domain-containing protein [Flavobacteriales bacterium]MDG1348314.1 cytochrome c biogenesis protein CcdA [Flavobacteriales bacterium]